MKAQLTKVWVRLKETSHGFTTPRPKGARGGSRYESRTRAAGEDHT